MPISKHARTLSILAISSILLFSMGAGAAELTEHDRFFGALAEHSLLGICATFLLAGFLLSLSPCVLPMAPILWTIVSGPSKTTARSRSRGLALSISFGSGMSIAYAVAGSAAALAGQSLAPIFQNSWVLGAFAAIMATLALSSFGLFDVRLPAFLERLSASGTRALPRDHLGSAFSMGALSALIVGPCVAPPLAGALAFIAQTRDAGIGAMALFSLAWGMCAPIIALGAGLGAALPRSGPWSRAIQSAFGVALLASAWVIASPIWSGNETQIAKSQPLDAHGIIGIEHFAPVASLAQLDAASLASSKPVLVELHADWCATCKPMREKTYPDSSVQHLLRQSTLLSWDATSMDEPTQAFMKRHGIFGPPALIAIDPANLIRAKAKALGYMPPEQLIRSISPAYPEHLNDKPRSSP